jgi:hypothetical protein
VSAIDKIRQMKPTGNMSQTHHYHAPTLAAAMLKTSFDVVSRLKRNPKNLYGGATFRARLPNNRQTGKITRT